MYVVFDSERGFLALNGPFAYPIWFSSSENAARFSWIQANDYANAYGGNVRSAA